LAFEPVLLIPCYNHGRQLATTLEALAAQGLPCLLIDDGSDSDDARQIDECVAMRAWVDLVRLPENRGKGAAVRAGIDAAAARGYSHALQVDADGQHAVADIPRLLERAEQQPAALVSGRPVYGADIPPARFYGRYVTHFLVWLETLSLDIADSMCGFRVYPVAATQRLMAARAIGRHMDFDTDIMVRLYWGGTPVAFVDTRVGYPIDGVSHFDYVRDNLRITGMHLRLLGGMLLRSPRLLWRRLAAQRGKVHWSQQAERGVYWSMWLSHQVYRVFGRRGLTVVLYPLVTYFFLTNAPARRASRAFLTRVHACGGDQKYPPTARDVHRHFFTFADCVADRIAAWRGDIRHEHVEFDGQDRLLEQNASGQGAVLITSHLGNIELCRGLNDQLRNLRMNVLVYNHHAPRINRLLGRINPNSRMKLVDIRDFGAQTAAWLKQQVDAGEFVAIAGDRTPPSLNRHVVSARFLGDDAPFPTGPFIIASLLRCPVYLMTCTRHQGRYRVEVVPFAERITLARGRREEDLQYWAQRYATDLEARALATPLQWFNFYDFWGHAVTDASPKAPAQTPPESRERRGAAATQRPVETERSD